MSCKNCQLATWEFSPTGKIKKNIAGRCMAEVTIVAPSCANVQVFKNAIWPKDGDGCPMFVENEATK